MSMIEPSTVFGYYPVWKKEEDLHISKGFARLITASNILSVIPVVGTISSIGLLILLGMQPTSSDENELSARRLLIIRNVFTLSSCGFLLLLAADIIFTIGRALSQNKAPQKVVEEVEVEEEVGLA